MFIYQLVHSHEHTHRDIRNTLPSAHISLWCWKTSENKREFHELPGDQLRMKQRVSSQELSYE